MHKVYNLKLDVNFPKKYAMTDECFCEGLKEVIAEEMDDDIKYVKMTAECVDKDQQIAELKEELEELKQTKDYQVILMSQEKIRLLETQLKSQPREIVEKIKEYINTNTYYYEEECFAEHINSYLDKILKEYGRE